MRFSTIKASRPRKTYAYMVTLGIHQKMSGLRPEFTQNARYEMSPKKTKSLEVKRKPITQAELETALAEAVRAHDAHCEGLIAIIVERVRPTSPVGSNWRVKGVKYGKAERDRCEAALSICVEKMQREIEISD